MPPSSETGNYAMVPYKKHENSKTKNTFLSLAMFCHECPLAVKPATMPWCLLPEQTWRDSIPTDMLLSAVS
jgi:hypothetical protein